MTTTDIYIVTCPHCDKPFRHMREHVAERMRNFHIRSKHKEVAP